MTTGEPFGALILQNANPEDVRVALVEATAIKDALGALSHPAELGWFHVCFVFQERLGDRTATVDQLRDITSWAQIPEVRAIIGAMANRPDEGAGAVWRQLAAALRIPRG